MQGMQCAITSELIYDCGEVVFPFFKAGRAVLSSYSKLHLLEQRLGAPHSRFSNTKNAVQSRDFSRGSKLVNGVPGLLMDLGSIEHSFAVEELN